METTGEWEKGKCILRLFLIDPPLVDWILKDGWKRM